MLQNAVMIRMSVAPFTLSKYLEVKVLFVKMSHIGGGHQGRGCRHPAKAYTPRDLIPIRLKKKTFKDDNGIMVFVYLWLDGTSRERNVVLLKVNINL